jgi:hypothetical protein
MCTVAGAVTTDEADTLLRSCAMATAGAVELSPDQALALCRDGALLDEADRSVPVVALVEWLASKINSVYGQEVPGEARHVYLLGRLSGRRARDPGLLALSEAGWVRRTDGTWRRPGDVSLLGQVAVARGFGAEVKAILTLRQLTTTWLASELGVSRQRLTRVLTSDVTMPIEQYLSICAKLSIAPGTHATLGPHTTQLPRSETRTT